MDGNDPVSNFNPTERFSSRVENYVKYRPDYPPAILRLLQEECGLTADSVVADIGSGTGKLAVLFLENGNRVYGVEPNNEMRQAGERILAPYPDFASVSGSAEHTTLPDASIDFVTAGQAFHWFDRESAQGEFARILKPGGWVVLVWNDRRIASTPFLVAYERLLLLYGTDYRQVTHKEIGPEEIGPFFGAAGFQAVTFENRQMFDFEGLKGRLLSSSYTPESDHPSYQAMIDELYRIFNTYQDGGKVAFEYDTQVYFGRMLPGGPTVAPKYDS